MRKKQAQVIIEFCLAVILMVLFVLGTTKIFIWGSRNLSKRHQYYEATRSENQYRWNNQEADLPLQIFDK